MGPPKGLELIDARITHAVPNLIMSLKYLNLTSASTKTERKVFNATNEALKLAQVSLRHDKEETEAWGRIFAASEAGSTRASLESRVIEAERMALMGNLKRLMAESQILRAGTWLSKLHKGRASHAEYIHNRIATGSTSPDSGPMPMGEQEEVAQEEVAQEDDSMHEASEMRLASEDLAIEHEDAEYIKSENEDEMDSSRDRDQRPEDEAEDMDRDNEAEMDSIYDEHTEDEAEDTNRYNEDEIDSSHNQHLDDAQEVMYQEWLRMPPFEFENMSKVEMNTIKV